MQKSCWGFEYESFKSKSRDPGGQIQGQIKGKKVMTFFLVPTLKVIHVSESLFHSLSNDTNFIRFGPLIMELWLFKV